MIVLIPVHKKASISLIFVSSGLLCGHSGSIACLKISENAAEEDSSGITGAHRSIAGRECCKLHTPIVACTTCQLLTHWSSLMHPADVSLTCTAQRGSPYASTMDPRDDLPRTS